MVSYPRAFLTPCAGGKYTRSLQNAAGNAAAEVCLPERENLRRQQRARKLRKFRKPLQRRNTQGGLLCQSVLFNRGNDAAPKHTGFVRA
jgi:hypothetical protein